MHQDKDEAFFKIAFYKERVCLTLSLLLFLVEDMGALSIHFYCLKGAINPQT